MSPSQHRPPITTPPDPDHVTALVDEVRAALPDGWNVLPAPEQSPFDTLMYVITDAATVAGEVTHRTGHEEQPWTARAGGYGWVGLTSAAAAVDAIQELGER